MNYFTHGYRFTSEPYFLAGTAVPDWLAVADRGVRVRPKHAQEFTGDGDPRVATVARGILQHHADDAWFHATAAFYELSTELTGRVRSVLPQDGGFRASFLGHVLLELLLDDVLIAKDRTALDDYYAAMASVDPLAVERAVNAMAPRPTERLAAFIERFLAERFLSDYADDARLLFRLNQVMRRANLPQLPEVLQVLFPAAREMVRARRAELLAEQSR